jgi:hypothetical protein
LSTSRRREVAWGEAPGGEIIFGMERNKLEEVGFLAYCGLVAKQLHGRYGNFARGFAELAKTEQRNKEEIFSVQLLRT